MALQPLWEEAGPAKEVSGRRHCKIKPLTVKAHRGPGPTRHKQEQGLSQPVTSCFATASTGALSSMVVRVRGECKMADPES